MSKVRINDLARELEVKSKAILDVLKEVGVTEPKTHSSSLEADEAQRVRSHFQRGSSRNGGSAAKAESGTAPKIDWSRVSKPGDVLKAIQQRKEEAERPAPRAAGCTAGGSRKARSCSAEARSQHAARAAAAAATPAAPPKPEAPARRVVMPQPRQAPPIVTAPPAQPPAIAAKPPAGPVVARPPVTAAPPAASAAAQQRPAIASAPPANPVVARPPVAAVAPPVPTAAAAAPPAALRSSGFIGCAANCAGSSSRGGSGSRCRNRCAHPARDHAADRSASGLQCSAAASRCARRAHRPPAVRAPSSAAGQSSSGPAARAAIRSVQAVPPAARAVLQDAGPCTPHALHPAALRAVVPASVHVLVVRVAVRASARARERAPAVDSCRLRVKRRVRNVRAVRRAAVDASSIRRPRKAR